MKTILVTGATGNLGRAAIAALKAKGFSVRAASRQPQQSSDPAVQYVRFDYEDTATHLSALEGVSGVLLIAPPLDLAAPAKLIPVIDQAKALDIEHIVFNSALGVDANEDAPLRKIEKHLISSGVNYTILRPNFFMENFSTGFIAPMIAQGGIFLAAGDAKTSFISVTDIAAVAAEVFVGKHYGQEYNLTGPEALDHAEVAQIISQISGKAVAYHAISEEAMLDGARQNGLPESAATYLAILYGVVRNGWAAGVTTDVQLVSGQPAMTFKEFSRQNANYWK